jgi:hypothetical protein
VKFCEYRVTKFSGGEHSSLGGEHSSLGGGELSSLGGGEHSSPNNININNIKEHNIGNNINNKGASACESKNAIIGTKSKNVLIYYPLDQKLNSAFADYVDNRKKLKKPMTDRAIALAIKKLDEMTHDNDEKIEILNQSIMNGWAGLFPLKGDKKQASGYASNNKVADQLNDFYNMMDEWVSESEAKA